MKADDKWLFAVDYMRATGYPEATWIRGHCRSVTDSLVRDY